MQTEHRPCLTNAPARLGRGTNAELCACPTLEGAGDKTLLRQGRLCVDKAQTYLVIIAIFR